MRVTITRIDPSLPLPVYATVGAAGFDLYSRTRTVIEPGAIVAIPSNVVIAVPDGHVLVVALRSSTPRRKGLSMPHGVGIVDADYCGRDDEVGILVYNLRDSAVVVERGERIAQGLIVPVPHVEWEERAIEGASRGGFGSTG